MICEEVQIQFQYYSDEVAALSISYHPNAIYKYIWLIDKMTWLR